MTRSRAALAGPYQGATLPCKLPDPLDHADRLAHWERAVRLEVCQSDLLSGLHFGISGGKNSFGLSFFDLTKPSPARKPIVRLTRPSDDIFKAQCALVSVYADLREDRGAEVLAQMVPPTDFWASIIGLQAHRHPWTLELLDLAYTLAVFVHMRFKQALACQRPVERSPQIQPMIPAPGHASLPSGHATEAYIVATVLQALLDDARAGNGKRYEEQLQRLAARIAVNRTVAGLHYPVDSAAGRLLGTALGEFFLARCQGGPLDEYGFRGERFHGPRMPGKSQFRPLDFDPRVSLTDGQSGYYELIHSGGKIPSSPLMAFMWKKARQEWQPLR